MHSEKIFMKKSSCEGHFNCIKPINRNEFSLQHRFQWIQYKSIHDSVSDWRVRLSVKACFSVTLPRKLAEEGPGLGADSQYLQTKTWSDMITG
jgi:hypothetical protein